MWPLSLVRTLNYIMMMKTYIRRLFNFIDPTALGKCVLNFSISMVNTKAEMIRVCRTYIEEEFDDEGELVRRGDRCRHICEEDARTLIETGVRSCA